VHAVGELSLSCLLMLALTRLLHMDPVSFCNTGSLAFCLLRLLCLLCLLCLLRMQLEVIMSRLLDVGSAVATPTDASSQTKLARVQFPKGTTAQLEVSMCNLC
jgi:hypothetical protein